MKFPPSGRFATTRWTVVMAAVRESASGSREALEDLCTRYWPPLYSFARRRGYSMEEAQDLTQSFFARFLQKGSFSAADRERGRFRSFLLASFKHFLANEWDRDRAQKRGGGVAPVPIEVRPDVAEGLYARHPVDAETPEVIYERQWAWDLLERATAALQTECIKAGRGRLFACLQAYLEGDSVEGGYAAAAQALGMTEGSVKVTVHRLRRRYRDLLRAEIARTVEEDSDIDAELRHLITVLGRDPAR